MTDSFGEQILKMLADNPKRSREVSQIIELALTGTVSERIADSYAEPIVTPFDR